MACSTLVSERQRHGYSSRLTLSLERDAARAARHCRRRIPDHASSKRAYPAAGTPQACTIAVSVIAALPFPCIPHLCFSANAGAGTALKCFQGTTVILAYVLADLRRSRRHSLHGESSPFAICKYGCLLSEIHQASSEYREVQYLFAMRL
jgi:hypothetical protein